MSSGGGSTKTDLVRLFSTGATGGSSTAGTVITGSSGGSAGAVMEAPHLGQESDTPAMLDGTLSLVPQFWHKNLRRRGFKKSRGYINPRVLTIRKPRTIKLGDTM